MILPFGSGAVEVRGLYETQLAVADQSDATRQLAVTEALGRVLVKVGGHSDISAVALNDAPRYVQQYRYRSVEQPEGGSALELWVRFDAAAVDRLLRDSGLSVWGNARPLTLVWLAVEQDGRRELVGANDGGLAREVLLDAGRQRGLPVRLPLLDLADQARVQPADIWGDFHRPIVEVSERYNPQAVLVGRLYPASGGLWGARWSLYQGERSFRWEAEGAAVEPLLAAGVEGAADRLSASYGNAVVAGAEGALLIEVAGIEDFAGYRRVMDYLGKLSGDVEVQVVHVMPAAVSFLLRAEGSHSRLVNALALGDTLIPVPPETQQQGLRGALLYRLEP